VIVTPDPAPGSEWGEEGAGTQAAEGPGRFRADAARLRQPPAGHRPPDGAAAGKRVRELAESGQRLLRQERYVDALRCFQEALQLQPNLAGHHIAIAVAADGARLDALVEKHAAEGVRLAPENPLPHHVLARWCYRNGQLERGLGHSARAVKLAPRNVEYVVHHATLLFASGKARDARDALQPVIAAGSTDRWLASLHARLAPSLGEESGALELVERALQAPGLPPDPGGAPLLHFEAAKLLDRAGRYPEAFDHARRGNETLRRWAPPHDPVRHSDAISRRVNYFTPQRVAALPRATHDSRRPIFILGMPRSGTTLVEQILGCHPSVHAGGELQALRLVAREIAGADWAEEPYPAGLDDLSLVRANALASAYLSALNAVERNAPFVTDKQPLNFLVLEVIELLFPRSRVIHCVRGALDTCLSCYMTNFEVPNAYKFDLAHLGAYYRDYRRLMEHWKKVLTVPILDVRYEDVVLDTRGQVRRILDFLGLPWDEACMRYYDNPRVAHTASVDQVRRPIYTASIGRWKHYEKELAPLIRALGSAA
jgi:tetratricopeptide (TPR) repeat protein